MSAKKNKTKEFEEALAKLEEKGEKYVLKLFIAGTSPESMRSLANIRKICDEYLGKGKYELEVIDVYQQPILARKGQILAAPTLLKNLPPPLKKLIGNLSKIEKVIVGLDLHAKKK